MKTYRIQNISSGIDLGDYEAEDEESALQMMARVAGYDSYEDACSVVGDDTELEVTEV